MVPRLHLSAAIDIRIDVGELYVLHVAGRHAQVHAVVGRRVQATVDVLTLPESFGHCRVRRSGVDAAFGYRLAVDREIDVCFVRLILPQDLLDIEIFDQLPLILVNHVLAYVFVLHRLDQCLIPSFLRRRRVWHDRRAVEGVATLQAQHRAYHGLAYGRVRCCRYYVGVLLCSGYISIRWLAVLLESSTPISLLKERRSLSLVYLL